MQDENADETNPPVVPFSIAADKIWTALKWLIAATVVLYICLGGLALYSFSISQNNANGLCALRNDAQARVDASNAFLKENPKGIPGISVEQLKRSVDNAKRTTKALEDVDCPVPTLLNPLPPDDTE